MHLSNTAITEHGVLITLHEFLTIKTKDIGFGGFAQRDPFTFLTKSGKELQIGIQASSVQYCTPQETSHEFKFYSEVEGQSPSWTMSEEVVEQYAEDPENPTSTLYAYIPLVVLAKEIYVAIQD